MIYIYVTYEQKDIAKSLGARWDPNKKLWYAPDNTFKELLDTFSPLESKSETKPSPKVKITINKQSNYIKFIGENTSFREGELYIDLIPKNTKFSLYHNVSKEDYYKIKDTLTKRTGLKCEICQSMEEKNNLHLCERFSYNIQTKIQKLEIIHVLCNNCFITTRLRDKIIALEHLQEIFGITKDEAKKLIYNAFELWKERCNIQWNLDVSLLINSGITMRNNLEKEEREDKSKSTILESNDKDTKKITIQKKQDSIFSNTTSSKTQPSNVNFETKKIFIKKSINEECLL